MATSRARLTAELPWQVERSALTPPARRRSVEGYDCEYHIDSQRRVYGGGRQQQTVRSITRAQLAADQWYHVAITYEAGAQSSTSTAARGRDGEPWARSRQGLPLFVHGLEFSRRIFDANRRGARGRRSPEGAKAGLRDETTMLTAQSGSAQPFGSSLRDRHLDVVMHHARARELHAACTRHAERFGLEPDPVGTFSDRRL